MYLQLVSLADSVEVKFVIQLISFLIALIVTHMILIELHKKPNAYLKYLLISFSIILIQQAFMLTAFSYNLLTAKELPELFQPIVDHSLRVLGFSFLFLAFAYGVADTKRVRTMFTGNLIAFVIGTPVIWFCWYRYYLTAPVGRQRFTLSWIDPVTELWLTLILVSVLWLIRRASAKVDNGLLLSFFILLTKQILHLGNIFIWHNAQPMLLLGEQLLLVPFFYTVIIFMHNQLIAERNKFEKDIARLGQLELVGEMAAGIGHEIRNPMTTVRGFLQLLSSKEKFVKEQECFNLMIDELDRANSIISEFLLLAKNKSIQLKQLNLNKTINSILPLLHTQAVKAGDEIVFSAGELPKVLIDEKEIKQLIFNLVQNGLEAMEVPGKLTITTFRDGEGKVVMSIQDEGKGIPAELVEKVGTPFFSTKDQGVGLGLAISYSIVSRHKAEMDIETGSTGTTFSIRFNAA